MGLISANVFESQSVLIHTVVAAADPRYLVANSGENELRKITWLVKIKFNDNWTKTIYLIYMY